jgi:Protein of unknown function (DUF3455)
VRVNECGARSTAPVARTIETTELRHEPRSPASRECAAQPPVAFHSPIPILQTGKTESIHKESDDMRPKTSLIFTLASALVIGTTMAVPQALANDDVTPPAVPANLQVTGGEKPFLIGRAYGTQNYSCLPSATGSGYSWTLFGPQATLFDGVGDQIITHFLSPNPDESGTPRATWQHSQDTSSVWAVAIATSTDPNYVAPGAIPWLLLRVVGTEAGPSGGAKLTPTVYIQRVNTAGGAAPATGCKAARDVGRRVLVPYATDYVFYKGNE